MKKEILILIIASLIVLPLASAGIFDWITGKAAQTQGVNITVGNTGPQITNVSAIANVNLNKYGLNDGKKTVSFSFIAYDHDSYTGYVDLDDATAYANFTKVSEGLREASCSAVGNIDTNSRNYTCSIDMYYFDATGSWAVTAYIRDKSAVAAINDTTTFTVNSLDAMDLSPAALTFPTLIPGATNQEATNDPTVLNNSGNQNFTIIEINATILTGESDNSIKIGADLFKVNSTHGVADACSADAMSNSTYVTITGASLIRGNLTAGNGKEQLYYCLTSAPAILTKQSYSTAAEGAWSVNVR
jgi:hypothetical protein